MIGKPEDLISYAAARGVVIAEDEAPVLLVNATDYMNTFSWVGTKPAGQDDSWPRTDIIYNGDALINEEGDVVTVIEHSDGTETPIEIGDVIGSPPVTPKSIILATYRAAMAIGEGADIMAVTSGGKVKQESVSGAVSITYADGTETDPLVIPGFDQLVAAWLANAVSNGINFPVMRG